MTPHFFSREVKKLLDIIYRPTNLIMTFFGIYEKKKKEDGVFTAKTCTYTRLFKNVIYLYHTIYWCKSSNIFASYSYTFLIVNWEGQFVFYFIIFGA